MNKTKIEWCDFSWNPIVGCWGPGGTREKPNHCSYCYGKRIAKRFFKDNPNYEPKFYPERLVEPSRLKKPSKIFVCSMADLFGDWVKICWLQSILCVAVRNPQHTFQFLTKNPKRYLEFRFSKNCWLGTTVTNNEGSEVERLTYLKKKDNYKFVSIEPLLGNLKRISFSSFDLVIVGAMTGPGAIKPKKEWIDSIKHPNIFYKNNIKKYLK